MFKFCKPISRIDKKNAPSTAPKITFWIYMQKVLVFLIALQWIISIWQIYFRMLDNFFFRFWGQFDTFLFIINQKQNYFMGHYPYVIQNAAYNKHVYQHSKPYVGVGSCIKGGGGHVAVERNENVAILSWLCYINNRVLLQFLGNFCMKTDKFLSFFVAVIYICKEMPICMFKSNFCILHISKSPLTIVHPCITPILFLRMPILLYFFGA